jgi:hypothetical protein
MRDASRLMTVSQSVAQTKAAALLSSARDALAKGDTASAIIQADDALELFLQHLCVSNGCDESTTVKDGTGKDKPFTRWGFTEYIQYLDSKGLVSKDDKSDFFKFHQWRNLAHHHGVEPKESQTKMVVDRIEEFIKENQHLGSVSTIVTKIMEVDDIHPIFRASPFLVEPGSRLVQGEKYLSDKSLNQIDLSLRDKSGGTLYTEIKWSGVDLAQVDTYKGLLKTAGPHRLLWLIPSDLGSWSGQLKAKGVEVKQYDREEISTMVHIRKEAKEKLQQIQANLSAPFEASIFGDKIKFSNVIEACYFQGRVKTDKGERELGLKQTATGRHFDVIRCVAGSHYSNSLPELTILLIRELLHAPFYYKSGRFLKIARSLISAINEGYLHSNSVIIGKFNKISSDCSDFRTKHESFIRKFYLNDQRNSDLIWRVIQDEVPTKHTTAAVTVKEVIVAMKKGFSIKPTPPPSFVKHSVLGKEVANLASVEGFENDMARRLAEIATLKRMLIPVTGLPQMWVLVPRMRNGKMTFERAPCQNFTLNTDPRLYLEVQNA